MKIRRQTMLPMFKIQPVQNDRHFENFIAANEKHVHCKIASEVIEMDFGVRRKGKVKRGIKSDGIENGKKRDKEWAEYQIDLYEKTALDWCFHMCAIDRPMCWLNNTWYWSGLSVFLFQNDRVSYLTRLRIGHGSVNDSLKKRAREIREKIKFKCTHDGFSWWPSHDYAIDLPKFQFILNFAFGLVVPSIPSVFFFILSLTVSNFRMNLYSTNERV